MSFLDDFSTHFFDNERKQRRDIERLKRSVDHVEQSAGAVKGLAQRIEQLERRVDQSMLLSEALVELIVTEGWASSEQIQQFVQQIEREWQAEQQQQVETTTCSSCGQEVAKTNSYVSSLGTVCPSCHHG